jgi:hypothetical protein
MYGIICSQNLCLSYPLRVTSLFEWLETTGLSTWVREEPSMFAFPFILIVHAWGMGLLAGANAAVDLRVLGVAPRVPLKAMQTFYPVMWIGFVLNTISGLLLLIGYPTKALTNPVFYMKIGCIVVGMVLMLRLQNKVVRPGQSSPGHGRTQAVASLLVWAGAILSGRLLAYTCKFLMWESPC